MGEPSPSTGSTLGRARPHLVATLEAAGVLTLIASVFSVAVNTVIFRQWGLSFVSVASTSDILLSGISQIDVAVWTLVALSVGYAFMSGLAIWRWRKAASPYSPISFVAIVAASAIISYIAALRRLTQSGPDLLFYAPWVAVGSAAYILLREWPRQGSGRPRAQRLALPVLALLIVVNFGLYGLNSLVQERASSANLTNLFVSGIEADCGAPARVTWLGVESGVAACPREDALQYLIFNRSSVTLRTGPAPARPVGRN